MTYRKRHEKEQIQIAIVNYLRAVLPSDFIVHHSRNGDMSSGENGRAKAMGALAGWPNIEIAGRERYGVLTVPSVFFMEALTAAEKLSVEQKQTHLRLRRLGFKVALVGSIDNTIAALIDWNVPRREVGFLQAPFHGDAA